MATDNRPQWQIDLLWLASWTRHEFISALCGRDPAETSPDKWTADRWDDEWRRAERFVDAAFDAGELTPDFFGSVIEERPYGDYRVPRDEAIRWAAARRHVFPKFPFTEDHLPPRGPREGRASELSVEAAPQPTPVGEDAPAGEAGRSDASVTVTGTMTDLKNRRAKLLADYKRATGVNANKRIYENRKAGIHKPQFYQWLRGELAATSATAINFERFLAQKQPPAAN